jgi:hypothetical protein
LYPYGERGRSKDPSTGEVETDALLCESPDALGIALRISDGTEGMKI